jgi:signal transduction histidine kinase
MSKREFELQGVGDPRLAAHATSACPVWLWSTDGGRILWANPVGARLFGAANGSALARTTFGPADAHRRQIAQLAGRLPPDGAIRLERLRGFGAPFGGLMTCSCTRLVFPDGSHGVLVAAIEPSGHPMPLIERLQRLVEGVETPIVAFAHDGLFVGASETARALLGFPDLAEAGLDAARNNALTNGRVEMTTASGHMVLQRVGTGSDVGLVAMIAPSAASARRRTGHTSPVQDRRARSAAITAGETDKTSSATPHTGRHRYPLRFAWQMDVDGRFSFGSDEFTRLIGPGVSAGFGRPWHEIAEAYGIDPSGRVPEAVATRESWSGITIYWPIDGGGRLPVELSGSPILDADGNFRGYRGVGVCHVLDSLAYLADLRGVTSDETPAPPIHADDTVPDDSRHAVATQPPAESADFVSKRSETPASIADDTAPHTDLDEPVAMPENVVPFRPLGEPKSPALTAGENHAFDELARQLSARLERETGNGNGSTSGAFQRLPDQLQNPQPEWLAQPEPPARGESARDRALFDLLPTGVLIYRLDRMLYANPAFLQRIGYDSLHALEQAGGLDVLYVAPGVSQTSSTSENGTPVTISAFHESSEPTPSAEARLFTISWDGDCAHALMLSPDLPTVATATPDQQSAASAGNTTLEDATAQDLTPDTDRSAAENAVPAPGHTSAEDLAAILNTTAEGIVMFDAEGNISGSNRRAEALFGYDGTEFVRHRLADLFAPESQRAVFEYLESVKGQDVKDPDVKDLGVKGLGEGSLDHGRDVLARISRGGVIPLSMTMGRIRPDGPNFFALFRDISHSRTSDVALPQEQEQPQADRAAATQADILARIGREVRVPLNAILGLAEGMLGQGPASSGDERYTGYARDIRASGERAITIINDLLELSRIETGDVDLAFDSQNLNEMVESCVSAMQPQANRERIVIRTSLAQALPPVVADGRALRQITLNLIGNSIHLANPAGQVIVSTALSDVGDVVLRVRDTGLGLNDNEIAAALEPFRNPPSPDQDSSAVSLSLTKALVEANRARFHIKPGGRSGTLIEVVFPQAVAQG